MKIFLVLLALVSEVTVEPPMVRVIADAYTATISAEHQCTASILFYIKKGSLEGVETVKARKYWTDDRIVHFCPNPKEYGSNEINRGHLRALMLTPDDLEKDVNYAANMIPVFRAANLNMLAVDKKIRELSKERSLFVKIYMGWDDSPRFLSGTNTDIPDTITYICIDPTAKTDTVLEVAIENK